MQKTINSVNNINNNPRYFSPENINAPAVAVFTTRCGGVSGVAGGPENNINNINSISSLNLGFKEKYDKNENVFRNYKIIADELGFAADNIIYAHQKHTDNILICGENFINSPFPLPDGCVYDAMVTDMPGILLSVRSADCATVLFWDEEHKAVGAAHCGWRGTVQKLQVKTALKMRELYNTDLHKLKAAIGPCISKCCYEVSKEFFDNFVNILGCEVKVYFEEKSGCELRKYYCDLKGVNKMLLENILNPGKSNNNNNIEVSRNCTCCEENLFYSHRRQGDFRGTHASFIGIKK